jgi:2-keto-4-pentenoate hydratase/2-oxohepta-3-ene-1,7-dioic acid hydratase in catechol pathway
MKFVRYGEVGSERPGILDVDGSIRALSSMMSDVAGISLLPAALEKLHSVDISQLPVVEGSPRLGPCVGSVGKFICIGLNYSDHGAESGMELPPEPVVFMKATSAICGPTTT